MSTENKSGSLPARSHAPTGAIKAWSNPWLVAPDVAAEIASSSQGPKAMTTTALGWLAGVRCPLPVLCKKAAQSLMICYRSGSNRDMSKALMVPNEASVLKKASQERLVDLLELGR